VENLLEGVLLGESDDVEAKLRRPCCCDLPAVFKIFSKGSDMGSDTPCGSY